MRCRSSLGVLASGELTFGGISGCVLSPGERMKKRASATSKKTKAPRRSMAAPKRRTARAMSRRSSSAAGQETELARLNRERDEVLEQLAAPPGFSRSSVRRLAT